MHAKDKKEIFNYENNLNELPQILSKLPRTMENFRFYPKYPTIFFNTIKTIIIIEYSEWVSICIDFIYIFL